ncbi:hypothetical protein C0J52_18429 [Blattella germanica]|nr:hypothetical protein C0J52_18429 [Blattella germanica]
MPKPAYFLSRIWSMVLISNVWRSVKTITTSKSLYKYLLRECKKLPEDAGEFYKHSIKQMAYEVHVLHEGYSKTTEEGMVANCTCTLVKGNKLMIVDTMTSWDKSLIVEKLKSIGVACDAIEYVSYKQHILETDPERIKQIIERAVEDASWVMKKIETTASVEQFWKAVNIWNTNPHLINRRLRGAVCMFTGKILNSSTELNIDSLLLQIKSASTNVTSFMTNTEILQTLQASNIDLEITDDVTDDGVYIYIKRLMPRNGDKFQECMELAVLEDTEGKHVIPSFPYSICYVAKEREICLKLKAEDNVNVVSKEWLKDQFFPKLVKWAETAECENEEKQGTSSLKLIDMIKYSQLYEKLKRKYGPEMLKVRSIVPSAEFLFPETDWIIGNHSDELTPWIPVIAARSSYTCQFFLLPCCCYELNGQKYQRINASISQYEEYLGYIYRLCKSCGFVVEQDRLRIPSTRRICFVSFGRSYPEEATAKIDHEIKKLIDDKENKNECSISNHQEEDNKKWSHDFKPRESVERVRNCTQLEKSLIEDLVMFVAKELLAKEEFVTIHSGNEERLWNKGGSISLGDLATLLPKEKLKKLKNECGGLQTLLRNHHYIFLVKEGRVQIKMPSIQLEPQKKKFRSNSKSHNNIDRKSSKDCWFYFNHPNGCPLSYKDCFFKH